VPPESNRAVEIFGGADGRVLPGNHQTANVAAGGDVDRSTRSRRYPQINVSPTKTGRIRRGRSAGRQHDLGPAFDIAVQRFLKDAPLAGNNITPGVVAMMSPGFLAFGIMEVGDTASVVGEDAAAKNRLGESLANPVKGIHISEKSMTGRGSPVPAFTLPPLIVC